MKLDELVQTSAQVSGTSRRLEKISLIADLIRRCPAAEVPIAVNYLAGSLRQGKIGVGYAALNACRSAGSAATPLLTLGEVDAQFETVAGLSGAGSSRGRLELLRSLFARATGPEQEFLFRLVTGELRQGSLAGIMAEAVARATSIPIAKIRRATMVSGNLAEAARIALAEGEAGLAKFGVTLMSPLQPMLAQTAERPSDALAELGRAALEYKLDGARIQAHKSGSDVAIFTRALNEVTPALPEIVQIVRQLPARELILDGEALALRPDGSPLPFQLTMRRFSRKLNLVAEEQRSTLMPFLFDCLYLDGESLIDRTLEERAAALSAAVPGSYLVPRTVTESPEAAEDFARAALQAGHEGIMAKSLEASYDAGSRGRAWLKVKRAHTLDLVVLAAEWGHGRRRGWLSNLHLGARDPASGRFVMLGKTFKGLTDAMLQWQTQRLLELESSRDEWTVYVRPQLVVEVAFSDVQASPHYPGGLALRFARVKRYREDKKPAEADTIDAVGALLPKPD